MEGGLYLKEEVLEKLIDRIAAIIKVDKSTLNANTDLRSTIKSLEMSQIISSFEEEYDCYIKYTELMHWKDEPEIYCTRKRKGLVHMSLLSCLVFDEI